MIGLKSRPVHGGARSIPTLTFQISPTCYALLFPPLVCTILHSHPHPLTLFNIFYIIWWYQDHSSISNLVKEYFILGSLSLLMNTLCWNTNWLTRVLLLMWCCIEYVHDGVIQGSPSKLFAWHMCKVLVANSTWPFLCWSTKVREFNFFFRITQINCCFVLILITCLILVYTIF